MIIWPDNKIRYQNNYTEPKRYNREHNNFGASRAVISKCCPICGKSLRSTEKRLCKSCYEYIKEQTLDDTKKESH